MTVEDAFIYHRVAANVANGSGPVFNPGERVEITTSALWTALLSLVRVVVGDRVGPGMQAVALGGALAVGGLAAGTLGAVRLQRRIWTSDTLQLPLTALAIAVSPMFWYWGTSGLETGLQLAWLGICFLGLCRRARGDRPPLDRPRGLLVLIGLGWFIRPELVVYTACFAAALAATSTRPTRRTLLLAGTWLVGPAVALQLLRMGYYGSLVPNTALAKDGGRVNWEAGWHYLVSSLDNGAFWVVCVVGLVATGVAAVSATHTDRRLLTLLAAPVVGAVLQLSYVARIGGDDLADRFTVVPLFALCLPAAVVSIPLGRWSAGPLDARATGQARFTAVAGMATCALLVIWAIVSLSREPLTSAGPSPYSTDYLTLEANPVELADLFPTSFRMIQPARDAYDAGRDVFIDTIPSAFGTGATRVVPAAPGTGVSVVLCCVGSLAAALPDDVWVVDQSSLGDPVGSRLEVPAAFDIGVNGKPLPTAWAEARLVPPSADESADVRAARRAVRCGDLARLHDTVYGELTVGRFLANIWSAPDLTRLSVPASPIAAEQAFCGS